ncbi:MAG: ATP synthase F1 subunit gamma [Ignavibacteriales bacterium]|nr:ATP synthase F1 subunit gamma [Ignavibacteriales bacterium]
MPSLKDIKNRISGVKNTQQITKAMKMVSVARLRKLQQHILSFKNYFNNLKFILSEISTLNSVSGNIYFDERDTKNILFIIVTSDRGLCGSFNLNLFRYLENEIIPEYRNYFDSENVSFICIGRKGYEYLRKNKFKIERNYLHLFVELKYDISIKLSKIISESYQKLKYDKVYIIYNEFLSTAKSTVRCKQFLPLKISDCTQGDKNLCEKYILEPDTRSLIQSLTPKYLSSEIWQVLIDSYASELSARMLAMDMATENTKEIIRLLSSEYNKKRQDSITREILEIVSGANALIND